MTSRPAAWCLAALVATTLIGVPAPPATAAPAGVGVFPRSHSIVRDGSIVRLVVRDGETLSSVQLLCRANGWPYSR